MGVNASVAHAQSAPVEAEDNQFEVDLEEEAEFLRRYWGTPSLRGTKCWISIDQAPFKPTFTMLHFFNPRHGHSLVSGQIVGADGRYPERVRQVSGSAGYNEYQDESGNTIRRYLMDLTSSYSKTSLVAGEAFDESGFSVRSHLGVRLNADDLSGEVAGILTTSRWETPLTGPVRVYNADQNVVGGQGVTANYMGGIECDQGSCGTVLPINVRSTWKLVGRNFRECRRALRNLPQN